MHTRMLVVVAVIMCIYLYCVCHIIMMIALKVCLHLSTEDRKIWHGKMLNL